VFELPFGENCMIVGQCDRQSDRQTDEQTDSQVVL